MRGEIILSGQRRADPADEADDEKQRSSIKTKGEGKHCLKKNGKALWLGVALPSREQKRKITS